jgi:hypothetical protein
MTKKVEKSTKKKVMKHAKKNVVKTRITSAKKHSKIKASKIDNYRSGLLEVDKQQDKYDKLFEQKLAEQYKEFRNLKEQHMQSKRFLRILIVIITIILIALLILSYG